jgi:hypothetical protein
MQARTLLGALGIAVTEVDGANADNKDERSRLWGVSGKRAVYPQVFVEVGSNLTFIGDGEDIQDLNDAGTLEAALVAAPRAE